MDRPSHRRGEAVSALVCIRNSKWGPAICLIPTALAAALLWPLGPIPYILSIALVGEVTRWAVYRRHR